MAHAVPISIEFFPPNTPVGAEKLKTVVQELSALKPEFFSVTYGAGGATREKTLATVQDTRRERCGWEPVFTGAQACDLGVPYILMKATHRGCHRPHFTARESEARRATLHLELPQVRRICEGQSWDPNTGPSDFLSFPQRVGVMVGSRQPLKLQPSDSQ